jgi:hypothetical protein
VHQLITEIPELRTLFDGELVRVSCIGGGPGSDFLGILKYMIAEGKRPRVTCYLYDKETAWGESWSDLGEKLDTQLRIQPSFQAVDVTDERSWKKHSKYLDTHLVTMIYFMSEIYGHSGAHKFEHLFRSAKPDTVFLFLDNNLPDVYGWFDALVGAAGIRTLRGIDSRRMVTTADEEKTDLEPYRTKFGMEPRLEGWTAYRVGVKVS